MPAVVIVGAQWGDEGKGKITDYLARAAHMVVRYQGGNNAGHTIVVGTQVYKFHLLPAGMLYPDKICVLGNGVVIDPTELQRELRALAAEGVEVERLKISRAAHFILPTHKLIDRLREVQKGLDKLGTTGCGIGPAYQDKVNRSGIRLEDAAYPALLQKRLSHHLQIHQALLIEGLAYQQQPHIWPPEMPLELRDLSTLANWLHTYLLEAFAGLKKHVLSTSLLINEALDDGQKVLLEGAQGTLLDIDHGTYPFVTSSNPTAGGACIGAGIGPTRIQRVLGVAKAYATRVGSGPLLTELTDDLGRLLQERGQEIGTTTGRIRRCGWLDLVALRYAVRINGITHLALTKLDVLDSLKTIKVCTAYKLRGQEQTMLAAAVCRDFGGENFLEVEPIYEELPGWQQDITQVRSWSQLPPAAMAYITFIEDYVRVPIALVSIGAERQATFARLAIWEGI